MESRFSAIPEIKGSAAAGGDVAELSGGGRGRSKVIIRSDGSFYFEVDTTPGETTVVSWTKLLKDHAAEISAGSSSSSKLNAVAGGQFPHVNDPPASSAGANPSMRMPVLGPVGENAGNKPAQPPSNRLNSVIEKIERLYVKASSDDEDLNNVVDSDGYDTTDSFINDSDLNDYFLVDNSAIEHDGLFVHRGKEIVEPSTLPYEQSKKRRKDLGKGSDGCENYPNPSNLAKPGKKPRKPAQLVETPGPFTVIPLPNVHDEDGKKSYNVSVGIDQSIAHKEKLGVYDRPEAGSVEAGGVEAGGVADARIIRVPKKVILLEKAIKDLEKLVAEYRPPSAEIQYAYSSSRATKMILPPEIKKELAKVVKYAEATNGMISKELVTQLMSIVGHLVRRRTLKRNLKVMVNTELSVAKQEKDTRVQLIKKEVTEMVTARIPLMKSKALEQQTSASQHFQEIGAGEREVLQWMDDLLEDKICDFYDLHVEGLEENAVPQARKLYAELSALWPNGLMDNHGIKRAICRAKDRRKASSSSHKDPEELKRDSLCSS